MPATPGYQPVAFHLSDNNATGAAHETLLKASMPTDRGGRPAVKVAAKHRRTVSAPTLLRSRQRRMEAQQLRQLLVLSSWEEQQRPRMVFAVTEGRFISTSYAAVPTAGGWLVIQL